MRFSDVKWFAWSPQIVKQHSHNMNISLISRNNHPFITTQKKMNIETPVDSFLETQCHSTKREWKLLYKGNILKISKKYDSLFLNFLQTPLNFFFQGSKKQECYLNFQSQNGKLWNICKYLISKLDTKGKLKF